MRKDDLSRRIATLLAAIRPRDSIAARIADLPASEREAYERHQRKCSEQYRTYETTPGQYYKSLIDGEIERPNMPAHIRDKLFGKHQGIPVGSTLGEAAELYAKMKDGRR